MILTRANRRAGPEHCLGGKPSDIPRPIIEIMDGRVLGSNLSNVVLYILKSLLKRLEDGTLSVIRWILELNLDGESLSLGSVAKVTTIQDRRFRGDLLLWSLGSRRFLITLSTPQTVEKLEHRGFVKLTCDL